MNNVTFVQFVEKKVAKSFDIDKQDEQYYVHPTFCISNLSDYIRLITLISSANQDAIEWETVIYRGMVDESYNLLPGLARIEKSVHDMEIELVNDFLTRRPDAFRGLTDFDTLAKMQHYGLPTRLLDFSLNPLVALYFACESRPSKNGRILCHGTYLKNDSSAYVNAICSAAIKKSFDENYTVDEYLCDEKMPLKKYMAECYINETTTVVRPKYWNQRIANQAGVFMVYPNNLRDRYYYVLKHAEELGINDAIRQYGRGKIDEKKIQEAMRIEPKENEGLEATSALSDEYFRKVYDSYRVEYGYDKTWDQMTNRFLMTEEIKELSRTIIQEAFCSIIIEAKNKKRILKDLSHVGIGADYIYPELEYTASRILGEDNKYAFRVDAREYAMILRLTPNRGEYSAYAYCYQRDMLDRLLNIRREEQAKAHPPVYRHTSAYARSSGEIEAWRASHRENVACREAIDQAIRDHFNGYHLDELVVTTVMGRLASL